MLWLVYSLEATKRSGGTKYDGSVCPGQPATSAAPRPTHRSWETRGLRWAIVYTPCYSYKALFFFLFPFFIYFLLIYKNYCTRFFMLLFFITRNLYFTTTIHTLIIYHTYSHILILHIGIYTYYFIRYYIILYI